MIKLEYVGISWNKHIRPTQGKCIHQPNLQSLWPFGTLCLSGRKQLGGESTDQMQQLHVVQGVQGPDRRWCDCLQNVALPAQCAERAAG